MGILIMLNNFLHDLSVAVFFCCMLVLIYLARLTVKHVNQEGAEGVIRTMDRAFRRIMVVSFGFIILLGVVRTITYKDYEWYNAVAHGQVEALVVKHIIFVIIIIGGIYYLWVKKSFS